MFVLNLHVIHVAGMFPQDPCISCLAKCVKCICRLVRCDMLRGAGGMSDIKYRTHFSDLRRSHSAQYEDTEWDHHWPGEQSTSSQIISQDCSREINLVHQDSLPIRDECSTIHSLSTGFVFWIFY